MLRSMSSSQFSLWAAYFRSLHGTPKEQRYVGSGKLTPRDWQEMSQDEQKKAKSQMYGMFRNYAVAVGVQPGAGGLRKRPMSTSGQ
jgi:hypothetical protein